MNLLQLDLSLDPCLALSFGGGLSFVQYLLIFVYLVVSMGMLFSILSPFKPDYSEKVKARYTVADIVVLILELGTVGAVITSIKPWPDLEVNLILMVVCWLVLAVAWVGGTALVMRAGIAEPKRRAVAVGFIIPVAFFGVFGFNAYVMISLYQQRTPHMAALLVPPVIIAAWFLARWANNRSSEVPR